MPSSGTSNFNRRGIMKKSILIVLISILLSYPMNLIGADFETPHEFKSGDTISAEMMNELFDYIKNKNKMITLDEILGTWNCMMYTNNFAFSGSGDSGMGKDMTAGTDSVYSYYSGSISFVNDGDGTYSYTTTPINIFRLNDSSAGSGKFFTKNNALFVELSSGGTEGDSTVSIQLTRISISKILMSNLYHTSGKGLFYECDKQNLVPNPPPSLTYALPADNTSSSITLTWTDNQTEAVTGYKVNRKTVVTDNFTTVSTITDNTTRTYADDNVTESGKYWYRVLAYNSNGDGTPSKVVKASFPDDQAPTGTLKIDNATTTTTSSSVTLNLTATDNKGVVGYLASESSAPPSTDSTSWVSITSTTSYSADVSFTLSAEYGMKFVTVWFKDGKGNLAAHGATITYSSQ